MKSRFFALFTASFLLIAPAAIAQDDLDLFADEPDCLASISGVVGGCEMALGGADEWEDCRIGVCLLVGDRVRTMAESSAALEYVDRADVQLNAFALATVERIGDGLPDALNLEGGELFAMAKKMSGQEGSSFQVRTPTATAAVRGTEFQVAVGEEGESEVAVFDGEVDIQNEFGVELGRPGLLSVVRKGAAPGAPQKFDVEKRRALVEKWRGKVKMVQEKTRDIRLRKMALKEKAAALKAEMKDAPENKKKELMKQAQALRKQAEALKEEDKAFKGQVQDGIKEAKKKFSDKVPEEKKKNLLKGKKNPFK